MFNTPLKQLLDNIDMNTWITSDTHFGHDNILDFEPNRKAQMIADGFDNQDEWIIHRWNSVIKPDDTVLHLGDFAFKHIQEVQPRLNGNIILILGNHDRKGVQTYTSFQHVIRGCYVKTRTSLSITSSTDELFSCLIVKLNGRNVLFSHYPIDTSEYRFGKEMINNRIDTLIKIHKEYGCVKNIHGHTHSTVMGNKNLKNVCFDNTGFTPVRIKDII